MTKKLMAPGDINEVYQASHNAVQACGASTGHVVENVAYCDTPARAIFLAGSKRVAEAAADAEHVLRVLIQSYGDNGAGIIAKELRAALIASGYREQD